MQSWILYIHDTDKKQLLETSFKVHAGKNLIKEFFFFKSPQAVPWKTFAIYSPEKNKEYTQFYDQVDKIFRQIQEDINAYHTIPS